MMKRVKIILSAACGLGISFSAFATESMDSVIERGLARAAEQSLIMAKSLEDKQDKLPRNIKNGALTTSGAKSWTSGFFPGTLWYLYENKPGDELKKYAEMYTARVEEVKNLTRHHDVGFMLYCSFGNGYRLTGNPHYLDVMKTGANSLSTRYREKVGAIQSWGANKKWKCPVIIDNMMNLEFLMFVGKKTGEQKYIDISNSHSQITIKNHFRDDNSSYHVVSYDPETGQPHAKNTHQGYADSSAWSRGQAWGLYGYTMMYRETGKQEYLEQARKIAAFMMNHKNMPSDKVPYWDFDAPDIPKAPRDSSAAAIMASALIELSVLDKSTDAPKYLEYAKEQIRSLTSPAYLAPAGSNFGFVILHGVGSLPHNSEVDTPLTYGDYYYIEALMRLKKLQNEK